MNVEHILELPLEIWEPIVKLCDKKSLINFALCSKECYELLSFTLFENVHLKWSLLSTARTFLPCEKLKFTKSLFFKESCTGDSTSDLTQLHDGKLHDDWATLVDDFKILMHSCDSLRLQNLSISNSSIEDSDLLPVFTKFINMKKLTLYGCTRLTSSTFQCISHLELLQKLSLTSCYVTDKYFLGLTSLIELSIMYCDVDINGSFDIISQISGLEKLTIVDNLRPFSDHEPDRTFLLSIENIKDLSLLEHLDLSMSCIPNEEGIITVLTSLKSLTFLNLSQIDLNHSLDSISRLHLLTELCLSYCNLNDEKLVLIKKLKYVRDLMISGNDMITDAGMVHINEMVSLQILDLSYDDRIYDEGIRELTSLIHLEKIILDCCYYLTDLSLIYLGRLPCLKKLGVEETQMSEEVLENRKIFNGWEYYKRWWE